MKRLLRRLAGDRSGATAIEYGLIALMIGVSLITGAQIVGKSVNNILSYSSNELITAKDAH